MEKVFTPKPEIIYGVAGSLFKSRETGNSPANVLPVPPGNYLLSPTARSWVKLMVSLILPRVPSLRKRLPETTNVTRFSVE